MQPWQLDRINSCVRGENPTVMAKMKSGYAVFGDIQFLPGYCVLLGYPKVFSLNELSLAERSQYILDTTLIGDAIIKVCNPLRINYATLMNTDPYLHTHIHARYDWEPEEFRKGPTWWWSKEKLLRPEHDWQQFEELKQDITSALTEIMNQAYPYTK